MRGEGEVERNEGGRSPSQFFLALKPNPESIGGGGKKGKKKKGGKKKPRWGEDKKDNFGGC